MKKSILIIALALVAMTSQAQMDFSRISYTLIHYFPFRFSWESNDTTTYSIEESMFLGEKLYWRIPSAEPDFDLWVRQEGSIVYAMDTLNKTDMILYDFSLSAGDTLWAIKPIYTSGYPCYYDYAYKHTEEPCDTVLVVDSVGTMTLSNGVSARVLYFNYPLRYPVVEGIGYLGGFDKIIRYDQPTDGSYYELLNLYVGEELIYGQNLDAALPVTNLNTPSTKIFKDGLLFFQVDEQIYDVMGRKK